MNDSYVKLPLASGFVTPILAAIGVGAGLSWPILKGLIALKSRQNVYSLAPQTHQKKQGTPTMGGIIILVGFLGGTLATSHDWMLCLWVLGFAAIGFADDYVIPRIYKSKRGLGWKQKIIAQLILACLGAYVFHLPNDISQIALMAFMVLFFSNAYNFADGLDSMAGSIGLLLSLGFFAISLCYLGSFPREALLAMFGAFIPFLFWNAPPAKVFMGDVGALSIGAFFGGCATKLVLAQPEPAVHPLTLTPYSASSVPLVVPVLILSVVMIIELVPVPIQVGYYKLTKRRIFPMTPIHHAFEVKGWPETRVAWAFILFQLLLVILAIASLSTPGPVSTYGSRLIY